MLTLVLIALTLLSIVAAGLAVHMGAWPFARATRAKGTPALRKLLSGVLAAAMLALLGTAALAWYTDAWPFGSVTAPQHSAVVPPGDHYVTLDKLVVMTRGPSPASPSQYLAMDLVFAVDNASHLERTKAQLPLLRSVAMRTLAAYEARQLRQMQVDEIVALLDAQFVAVYGSRGAMPFSQVMIARMIIE